MPPKNSTRRQSARGVTKSAGGNRVPPRKRGYAFRGSGPEIHIVYTILQAKTLANILSLLEEIKNEIVVNEEKQGNSIAFPVLLTLRHVNTGNSITINFGGTQIVIEEKISKKIIIPLLVITTAYNALNMYNSYQKARVELEGIKIDNKTKAVDLEAKELDLEIKKEAWQNEKDSAAGKLANYVIENKEIRAIKLNGVTFKKE